MSKRENKKEITMKKLIILAMVLMFNVTVYAESVASQIGEQDEVECPYKDEQSADRLINGGSSVQGTDAASTTNA
jgi:hypothetical protein